MDLLGGRKQATHAITRLLFHEMCCTLNGRRRPGLENQHTVQVLISAVFFYRTACDQMAGFGGRSRTRTTVPGTARHILGPPRPSASGPKPRGPFVFARFRARPQVRVPASSWSKKLQSMWSRDRIILSGVNGEKPQQGE